MPYSEARVLWCLKSSRNKHPNMDRLFGQPETCVTPRFLCTTGHSFVVNYAHLLREYTESNPSAIVRPVTLLTAAPPVENVFADTDDDDSDASGSDLGVDPLAAPQKGDKWAAILAKHTAFAADDGVDDGASDDDSGRSDSIDLSEAAPDDAEGGESGGSIGKDDGSYDLSDSFIDGAPSWVSPCDLAPTFFCTTLQTLRSLSVSRARSRCPGTLRAPLRSRRAQTRLSRRTLRLGTTTLRCVPLLQSPLPTSMMEAWMGRAMAWCVQSSFDRSSPRRSRPPQTAPLSCPLSHCLRWIPRT